MDKIFDLNLIWNSISITEFSFLRFLKIIFLILFLLINIGLLYSEYLENKNKDELNYLTAGIGNELKKIAGVVTLGLGTYSSYITVRDDLQNINNVSELRKIIEGLRSENKSKTNDSIITNFTNKLNLDSIERSSNNYSKIKQEKSELLKIIEDKKSNLKSFGGESSLYEEIKKEENRLKELNLNEERAYSELMADIAKGVKFSALVSNEKDESKIIEQISSIDDDTKKSSFLGLDEILSNFESMSGIAKLMCTLILSSSLILWCLFGIMLNIYGNYLLDRFKLEEKYPKIALFINYRSKLSKYYIMSNFLLIIIMCLMNIILGISILSL